MEDVKALKIKLQVRTKQLNDLQRYCAESLINKFEAESLRGVGMDIYKQHIFDLRDFKKKEKNGTKDISGNKIAEMKNQYSNKNAHASHFKKLFAQSKKMQVDFNNLINQKSKCICDLEKETKKLKSHLEHLEQEGVPQMSREISALRSQLTKTKAGQEVLEQRNFELQRTLEERTKKFLVEQQNSFSNQKRIIRNIFDRVNTRCLTLLDTSRKTMKNMDIKILSLESKLRALKGVLVRQRQQLHYFKNKSKRNIILRSEPKIQDQGNQSSIYSETMDNVEDRFGVRDPFENQMRREKQSTPNLHVPEYMEHMSMEDLRYHVNLYLREIETRCTANGTSMDFAGERQNLWYGKNSLVDQQALCKRSPTRPRSARKGVRKRLYSGKKGRVNRRVKSLVDLNLKRKKRVMAYVLNHRKNVGARILNGGYYHVVSNDGHTI